MTPPTNEDERMITRYIPMLVKADLEADPIAGMIEVGDEVQRPKYVTESDHLAAMAGAVSAQLNALVANVHKDGCPICSMPLGEDGCDRHDCAEIVAWMQGAIAAKDAEIARLRGEVTDAWLVANPLYSRRLREKLSESTSAIVHKSLRWFAENSASDTASAAREALVELGWPLPPAPRCDGETGTGGGA